MGLFKKQHKAKGAAAVKTVQTAEERHPFRVFDRYQPLCRPEDRMYTAMREAVPVIDAAIGKIVRLAGGFRVTCGDEKIDSELEEFLETVQVGALGRGIESFTSCFLDQMLTYGTAVGEIVLSGSKRNIAALYNAPLDHLELSVGDTPLDVVVGQRSGGKLVPVPRPHLVLMAANAPDPGELRGNSILRGLPFVSSVLLKIYNTIGVNFERVGNLRFAITYRPGSEYDQAMAADRAGQIAEEWQKAMQYGSTRDFVSVGDVNIRVIGADNQVLDSNVPVRQMLEQIVAKLGIPPFMLGLSWSTTERMSSQQADTLTSELEYYRRILTPVILRICRVWLLLSGYSAVPKVEWENINLQDEVELAKAELIRMQAKQIEEKL